MKKIIVLLILIFTFGAPALADEIHLNDGSVVRGKIITITDWHIEYDPEGDVPFDVFPRGQIEKIVYDSGRVVMLNEGRKAPAPDDRVVASYKSPLTGHRRHDGFYSRALLGFGRVKTEMPDFYLDEDLYLRGGGLVLNLQFGYAIMENFILFIESGSAVFLEADTELEKIQIIGSEREHDMGISTLGLGISWYFMPANFHVTPVISYGDTTFDGGLIEGDSRGGLYLSLYLGKEWWVSSNWGLGVSLFGMYGRDMVEVKSTGESYNLRHLVFGVLFTATYN